MPPSQTTAASPGPGVSKVFLSSTIEDYKSLRAEVHDAARKAETYCWLSEETTTTYESVEDYCRRMLLGSQGYILLLGHWYGSVPPQEKSKRGPQGRSITHLEFGWAFERWRDRPGQTMAVLMPELGSPLDRTLLRRAQEILRERHLDEVAHAASLEAFRNEVSGVNVKWRYIAPFDTVPTLREQVIVACNRFREGLLIHAPLVGSGAPAAGFAASDIGNAELGLLGRTRHVEEMKRAISDLEAGSFPALAVLVHGDRDAGHMVFLSHLFAEVLGPYKPRERRNEWANAFAGLEALCAWFARSLGLGPGSDTPEGVAERCLPKLGQQPLALLLDRVGKFGGGIGAFHAQFWRPFCGRLQQLWHPGLHRVLAILTTYSADTAAWQALARDTADDAAAPTDGSLLWPLPRLTPFTAAHFPRWFDAVGVVADATQRAALVRRLLGGEEGENDPLPLHVLDRLRAELDAGTIAFQERPA